MFWGELWFREFISKEGSFEKGGHIILCSILERIQTQIKSHWATVKSILVTIFHNLVLICHFHCLSLVCYWLIWCDLTALGSTAVLHLICTLPGGSIPMEGEPPHPTAPPFRERGWLVQWSGLYSAAMHSMSNARNCQWMLETPPEMNGEQYSHLFLVCSPVWDFKIH